MIRTTGFGQTGPYSDRPGFGTLVEAMSGFAYATGQSDGPPTLPPVALADTVCALHSAFAAMAALHWRDVHDGSGQFIDASILESMFAVLGDHVVEYGMAGEDNERARNRSTRAVPRNTYRTKDGEWIAISGSTEAIAERIIEIVGGDDLTEDERFRTPETRFDHAEELDEIVADWVAERTREEILDVFEANETPIGPVYSMEDIFEDPHFDERESVAVIEDDDLGAVPMRGVFPRLSDTPGEIRHTGPALGADALSVLTEQTSLSHGDVREMSSRGVTALSEERSDE